VDSKAVKLTALIDDDGISAWLHKTSRLFGCERVGLYRTSSVKKFISVYGSVCNFAQFAALRGYAEEGAVKLTKNLSGIYTVRSTACSVNAA